jgi:hypothetical protein
MNSYTDVIPLLTSERGFAESEEFKMLIGTAEDLPGVVASAYARYAGEHKHDGVEALQRLMRPFNQMASWHNEEVDTMLQDEVFEQLEADGSVEELTSGMSKELLSMLLMWRVKNQSMN